MRVLVLHNALTEHKARPRLAQDGKRSGHSLQKPSEAKWVAEGDVMTQVETVTEALDELGYHWDTFPCTLDLEAVKRAVEGSGADIVFNLVESLGGRDRLIHLVPTVLEAMAMPFTGASSRSMLASSNKLGAKRVLAAAGIETPEVFAVSEDAGSISGWFAAGDGGGHEAGRAPCTVVIKSVWEHGSLGLNDDSVLPPGTELGPRLFAASQRMGPCFAERYVEGREINVALLEGDRHSGGSSRATVTVLPASEILFEGYGSERPRIVGQRAKWDESSMEYNNTPRRLRFGSEDEELLRRLDQIALSAWDCTESGGCARVDFRIDHDRQPFVLEVNANPCLSPDAGFRAALIEAGIEWPSAVRSLLDAGLARSGSALEIEPPVSRGERRVSRGSNDA